MPTTIRLVLGILGALLVVAGIMVWLTSGARAHDWYPPECCSGSDCAPVPDGDIAEVAGGYRYLPLNLFIPYSRLKPSPDGRFHLCAVHPAGFRCAFGPTPAT